MNLPGIILQVKTDQEILREPKRWGTLRFRTRLSRAVGADSPMTESCLALTLRDVRPLRASHLASPEGRRKSPASEIKQREYEPQSGRRKAGSSDTGSTCSRARSPHTENPRTHPAGDMGAGLGAHAGDAAALPLQRAPGGHRPRQPPGPAVPPASAEMRDEARGGRPALSRLRNATCVHAGQRHALGRGGHDRGLHPSGWTSRPLAFSRQVPPLRPIASTRGGGSLQARIACTFSGTLGTALARRSGRGLHPGPRPQLWSKKPPCPLTGRVTAPAACELPPRETLSPRRPPRPSPEAPRCSEPVGGQRSEHGPRSKAQTRMGPARAEPRPLAPKRGRHTSK